MKSLKRLSICLVALTAIFVSTKFGFTAPIDDLIAGAKKEGTIEFYGPSTLTPQGAQALASAFNKKYRQSRRLGRQRHAAGVGSDGGYGRAPRDALGQEDASALRLQKYRRRS